MPLGYNPAERTLSVTYAVPTTGDRWFIPWNWQDTMPNQLAQCNKLVGTDKDGNDVGSEVVA